MVTIPLGVVHDYLTQRGGAERVVLEMLRAFPEAPLFTSLYDPAATFPEFADRDVRPGPLNRNAILRRNHRLALPFLAGAFEKTNVDAAVVLCSSSGWAHGVRTTGSKIVYCYTPARWLYQPQRYLGGDARLRRLALRLLAPGLRRWDANAASSADCYLAVSSAVQDRIRATYRRDAEVVHPPVPVEPDGASAAPPGVEPGFVLCVARLLPYKNVGAVVSAAGLLPSESVIVVGDGPLLGELRRRSSDNVTIVRRVSDAELRWLYRHARLAVTASYDDFGLVPIEAAAFGTPTVALRWGGHLDSIVDGVTGLFFEEPEPAAIAAAIRNGLERSWDSEALRVHAGSFSRERFKQRIREVVARYHAAV